MKNFYVYDAWRSMVLIIKADSLQEAIDTFKKNTGRYPDEIEEI